MTGWLNFDNIKVTLAPPVILGVSLLAQPAVGDVTFSSTLFASVDFDTGRSDPSLFSDYTYEFDCKNGAPVISKGPTSDFETANCTYAVRGYISQR